MPTRNTQQSTAPTVSLAPQLATATVNGSGVDHAGYMSVGLVIALGVFAGTTPTATLQIQDSPDNSVWTLVPAALLAGGPVIPQITPANANTVIRRAYIGLNRYVRVAITAMAGTGPSLPICALVDLGEATIRPTPASTT